HATCYAWVSYQTGYLKAHYPAEFQAANMSKNLSSIDEIKKIMDDCRKSGIKVLNPDINESYSGFTVNKKGDVRFGLGGIKGFGDNVVSAIVDERDKNGLFSDIYDFVERMSGIVNRKAFESLLYSGAFDSFGYSRAQYEQACESGDTFIEAILRYGELYRKDKMNSEVSLFGDSQDMEAPRPAVPSIKTGAEVDEMEFLHKEKELVGMYLSSHPLDNYTFELERFTNCGLGELANRIAAASAAKQPEQLFLGGFITSAETGTGWGGKPIFRAVIEDKSGSYEFKLNGKDIENHAVKLQQHTSVFIEGKIDEMFFRKPEERKIKGDPPYSFKIQKVILLGNVTETYLRGFSINVTTPMLNAEFRENLVKLIKKNKGTTPLTMFLSDPKTGYRIEFLSKKFQVGVSAALIDELTRMNISYGVIKK
ncbi:MAG: DNA polymerase III subunit alpha, partial [Bacteroidales bacterium]|nr:DNA polymerase III subunit alpha [Bacteroidales bacterium]